MSYLLPSSQEHVLSQTQSQYIKVKVNTSHHMKKAEEAHDALKKSGKLCAIKNQRLAQVQQEIAELERTWRNYEEQQQTGYRGRSIELQEDQVSLCQTTYPPQGRSH